MPWPDVVRDLAAWSLQIACIGFVAELMARLVPVRLAGFGYAYWRLVLAAAVVMPWLLRTELRAPVAAEAVPAAVTAAPFIDLPVAAAPWTESAPLWPSVLPWILVAGCLVRLVWVAGGIARLRALGRAGTDVTDTECGDIQQLLGTRARVRAVPGLAQPVTFGVRRPVVLIPERLAASPGAIRRAVVTHELVHVQRRDWLWVMAEEALRAVFWFHPAIWWITSRIRRAREEFTDHVAVLATGSRWVYMEALLSFADTTALQPAPAFARRAHLFQRIVLLSKAIDMSSQRVVLSGAVFAAVLFAGSWYASEAFPVTKQAGATGSRGQTAASAQQATGVQPHPVTPENPIPRRLYAVPVPYPAELRGSGISAALDLGVTVDAVGVPSFFNRGSLATSNPDSTWWAADRRNGNVASGRDLRDAARTRFVDSIEEIDLFRQAAMDAISQWQYEPPAQAPILFYVSVTFAPDAEGVVSQSEVARGVTASGGEARIGIPPIAVTATPGAGDLRERAEASLRAQAAVHVEREARATAVPREQAAAAPPAPAPGQPLRVGGRISAPIQTRKVMPVYPEIARAAHVRGIVIVEALIDEQGRVADVRILRSIPLLDQAALDAVRQWEYTPTLLNGVPVPVIMTVTVPFGGQQ